MSSSGAREVVSAFKVSLLVHEIARQIANQPMRPEALVPVMTGAFHFASDLHRVLMDFGINLPIAPVGTMKSGWRHDPETTVTYTMLEKDAQLIAGKRVLVVDTIWDTGNTAKRLENYLHNCHVGIGTSWAFLFVRGSINPARHLDGDVYSGMYLEEEKGWLVGYGLDNHQYARGKRYVIALDPVPPKS